MSSQSDAPSQHFSHVLLVREEGVEGCDVVVIVVVVVVVAPDTFGAVTVVGPVPVVVVPPVLLPSSILAVDCTVTDRFGWWLAREEIGDNCRTYELY